MRFCLIVSLFSAALAAQPVAPEQEQALRDRVTKFYTALKEGKYKAAFAMVADDAQDAFMGMSKPPSKSFSIDKIEWLEAGKQAKVSVIMERDVHVMGNVFPGRLRDESHWRVEEGEWWWFQPPETEVRTPFGTFKKPPASPKGEPPPKIDINEKIAQGPNPAQLSNAVSVNIPRIEFSISQPGEATLSVKNGLPGYVVSKVSLPDLPGLSASAMQANIGPGQTLDIKLKWTPGARPTPQQNFGSLSIEPLGRRHEFKILWRE